VVRQGRSQPAYGHGAVPQGLVQLPPGLFVCYVP
jgi:hypothetical protein